MTDKHIATVGPWGVKTRRTVFDNPWIRLVDHEVTHPDGSDGVYGVVQFKNLAIGVLPIDDEGYTWLVGQHRFAHDAYGWELPEGGSPVDASPEEGAKRELEEETGFSAAHWLELSRLDLSNSVTNEKSICYLAWGLTEGVPKPDPSEALTLRRVLFKDLLEMVMDGEITDSLTIVMTLTAHAKALRGSLPEPISRHILAQSKR